MTEPTVLVERRDALAIVTLNRPERRNGLTVEMCEALYTAIGEIARSDARVTVLRGAGNDFCVGADVGGESTRTGPVTLEDLGLVHHAARLLHNSPQVSIAAIDGGCAGAGLGWAAACDFRFASEEARFSTAFLNVGVSSDMGLPWSLPRIVGGARAREMLLFPGKIDARHALEWGLVTRLFPRESLHNEVLALAGQLCRYEPFALRMMKANLVSGEQLPLGEFIDIETARQVHCTSRPDIAARMAEAYAQSRKAQG